MTLTTDEVDEKIKEICEERDKAVAEMEKIRDADDADKDGQEVMDAITTCADTVGSLAIQLKDLKSDATEESFATIDEHYRELRDEAKEYRNSCAEYARRRAEAVMTNGFHTTEEEES